MAYENLCMYCFEDTGGETVCPHCGRDSRTAVPQVQLLPGTVIYGGRFLVGRALGQDANGVVYTALDLKLQRKLRIREYFPRDCASRLSDGTVVPAAGAEDEFDTGLKRVKASVQNAENPANRHFFFEENGTGYIVQRKSAAAAARAEEPEEETDLEESTGPNVKAIIGISAAAVVIVAIVVFAIVRMLGGAMDQTNGIPDVTQEEEWQPLELPTATPYVAATIGANVDYNGDDWKNEAYNGNVDQEFNEQVQQNRTPVPTAIPTYAPTPTPYAGLRTDSTISAKSSAQEIKDLQIVLAQQGWLSASDITGTYDTTTRNAVKAFQNFMNTNYNMSEKLTVDGIAGPKTLSCLVQYEYSRNPGSVTAQPTVAPTPQATRQPAQPTDVPAAGVDESSSPEAIRDVQTMLISLNMLDAGGRNGSYDAATRSAVLAFQKKVNDLFGKTVLNTTGTVDSLTLDYLKLYSDRYGSTTPVPDQAPTGVPQVTAEPTQQPTEAPQATEEPEQQPEDGSITPDSDPENIMALQGMLAKYGFLTQSQVDGVFGEQTHAALSNFQKYINAKQGREVLPVTGDADGSTLDMLLQMEDINTRAQIDESSSVEQISQLQKRLAELKWLNISGPTQAYDDITKAAVANFQTYINAQSGIPCPVQVTGIADPLTLEYLSLSDGKVTNPDPGTAVTAQPAQTEVPQQPEETQTPPEETVAPPEETQTPAQATETPSEENPPEEGVEDGGINAGSDSENILALQNELARYGFLSSSDADGSYGDRTASAVRSFQKFVNLYKGEDVLAVTGEADASTLDWLLRMEDELPYGVIGSSSSGSGVIEVQQRLISLKWLPEGSDTGEYDENTRQAVLDFQNYVNSQNPPIAVRASGSADVVTQQYLKLNNLVNPNPVSGGGELPEESEPSDELSGEEDTENPNQEPTPVIAETVAPTLEATDEPVTEPTAEPTPEPTAEPTPEPTAEPTPEPTAEPTPEPTAEPTPEPTAEPTPEPTAEPTPEPTAEPTPEPTAEPTPEPTAEPTPEPTAEPTPEPTAEPTPEPTAEPTPEPTAEPTPEPTAEPTPEPAPEVTEKPAVSAESAAEDIVRLQTRLVELNLLTEATGALDADTLNAVAQFQMEYNESMGGEVLTVIDVNAPDATVDYLTLCALFGVEPE